MCPGASRTLSALERSAPAETALVRQIPFATDVGRHATLNQHADVVGDQKRFAAFNLTGGRVLATGPVESVGIGAGIDRLLPFDATRGNSDISDSQPVELDIATCRRTITSRL